MYETMQRKYKNVAIQAPLATSHKAHSIHQSLLFNTVVCPLYLTSNQQKWRNLEEQNPTDTTSIWISQTSGISTKIGEVEFNKIIQRNSKCKTINHHLLDQKKPILEDAESLFSCEHQSRDREGTMIGAATWCLSRMKDAQCLDWDIVPRYLTTWSWFGKGEGFCAMANEERNSEGLEMKRREGVKKTREGKKRITDNLLQIEWKPLLLFSF